MATEKKVLVPTGQVLITCSKDWFTNEVFYTSHEAGSIVDPEALKSGQRLTNGESVLVREKIRNDAPGEKYDYTLTDLRITNRKGKALQEEVSHFNQG